MPAASGARRPAVFFDRDDTLIENGTLPDEAFAGKRGDLTDPKWIRPMPGALEGCRDARARGFAVIIVTNQGVVARGGATIDEVEAACGRTIEVLRGEVDAVLACPFHPTGKDSTEFCREHAWRKPSPGMLVAAGDLFGLDLTRSWMIGDAERDIEAGRAAGLPSKHCIRVGDGIDLRHAMELTSRATGVGHG